jgi:hypothetical protein
LPAAHSEAKRFFSSELFGVGVDAVIALGACRASPDFPAISRGAGLPSMIALSVPEMQGVPL